MALASLLRAARAPRAPGDVLHVGRTELPELRELESAGLRVLRAASVVEAIDLLGAGGVALAVVHAEALGDREAERFDALRRAGAAALVGLYPPTLAWRADRAVGAGADAALALPAAPGAFADLCRRLIGASKPGAGPAATRGAPVAPAAAAGPSGADAQAPWIESIVADVATMNRSLPDLDHLLDQALDAFRRRSGAERISILLYDRARALLHVRRTTAPPGAVAPSADVPDGSLASRVAKSGRATLLSDVRAALPADLAGAPLPSAGRDYRTRSCVLLPLRGAADVIGVACIADRAGGLPFTGTEMPQLEFLAAQAGQAIENGLEIQRLQELAAIDELTGIANRRQFQLAIEREVQRARRYDRPVSLAILDLDHFKQYNDTCGHQAGDHALAKVGELLRTTLREVDVVARYGGEEFAVILPETSARPTGTARNPFPFLERLRVRIAETAFPGAEKLPGGRLTVSGGVASFPDDATTVEELIREADRALYVSKSRGRNTISYRGRALTE